MIYQKLKQEFNLLSEVKQWKFALHYKDRIKIHLDYDNTTFIFPGEDSEDCTLFMFKADIGNRSGVALLLRLFGMNGENV